ncbi:MAG: CCA tRNA nucleotidyltransferase [Nanoarchaeota archaeon]
MKLQIKKNGKLELNALKIVEILKERGFEAYFVGGSVRDLLLGEELKDIDIATSAKPEEIKKSLSKIPEVKFLEIGESFNIVMAVIDKIHYEIATFRGEDEYSDGRRPEKVFFVNNAKEDAARRDFTINAMFYDPTNDELLDYFDGQKDLKDKVIRAIRDPNERFAEDYLRMLRAVRFAAAKNFEIEPKTLDAIKKNSEKISNISKERIKQEFDKIILSEKCADYVLLCSELGLFENMFEFKFDKKIVQNLSKTKPNLKVRYALLFEEKENISSFLRSLTFDNKTKQDIIWIVQNSNVLQKWKEMSEYERIELVCNDNFGNLVEFLKAKSFDMKNLEKFEKEFKKDKERCSQVKKFTLITGKDLAEIGVIPGKEMGEILLKVKKEYILGKINTKKEALEFAKSL